VINTVVFLVVVRFSPSLVSCPSTTLFVLCTCSKGISKSSIPYKRAPPSWLKVSTEEVSDHITRLAKKGLTPSQIGIILRDSHGIAQVKNVTGNKILRILKANGMHVHMSEILQLSFIIIINIDYTACLVATRTTGTADCKATLLLLLAQPTPIIIIIIIIIYSLTPSVSMLMIAF
jgi:hypothetical protein